MLPFTEPRNFLERYSFCGQYDQQSPPPPRPSSSTSFFPFSPPLFNPENLHELLAAHLLPLPDAGAVADIPLPLPPPPLDPVVPINSSTATAGRGGGSCSRRRASRKDRHSKIYTATGPRDRRMRLSLEVARKFFDLQDMLGFDKASKTVQWLFTMSKAAIKELAAVSRSDVRFFGEGNPNCQSSSTSECEDVSTVSDNKGKSSLPAAAAEDTKRSKARRVSARNPRKAASIHPSLARESRAKARARARERTREKKQVSEVKQSSWVPSSAPFDAIHEQESGSQSFKSSLGLASEAEEKQCVKPDAATEKAYEFPMAGGGSASIPAFDYGENIITCVNDQVGAFQEQWDMERALMASAQFQCRQCEAYNYYSSIV